MLWIGSLESPDLYLSEDRTVVKPVEGYTIHGVNDAIFNDAGHAVVGGWYAPQPFIDQALVMRFLDGPDSMEILFEDGDPVNLPGLPSDETWKSSYGLAGMDDSGGVLVQSLENSRVGLRGSHLIYISPSGERELLVRARQPLDNINLPDAVFMGAEGHWLGPNHWLLEAAVRSETGPSQTAILTLYDGQLTSWLQVGDSIDVNPDPEIMDLQKITGIVANVTRSDREPGNPPAGFGNDGTVVATVFLANGERSIIRLSIPEPASMPIAGVLVASIVGRALSRKLQRV